MREFAFGAYFALAGGEGVGGYALCNKSITCNNAIFTNNGRPPEDGGIGIDDDAVFKGGVAFLVGHMFFHRQRAQRHPLVEFHLIADMRGSADNNACAMIDEEALADVGGGVDVNACFLVGEFRQHTRGQGHAVQVERVGQPIEGNGIEAGIGENDFVQTLGCGVPLENGLGIGLHGLMELPQPLGEALWKLGGPRRRTQGAQGAGQSPQQLDKGEEFLFKGGLRAGGIGGEVGEEEAHRQGGELLYHGLYTRGEAVRSVRGKQPLNQRSVGVHPPQANMF